MDRLGIDIGGTGIKGAPVDLEHGALTAERRRILTPHPATPASVAGVVAELAAGFPCDGPIGVTFPAVVRRGVVESAANVDPSWVGVDASALLSERTGRATTVFNDADAAGIAEMRFGAGRGRLGTVIVVTFGTGIGTALFVDGHLVPNTELGHLELRGRDAERRAAASVKTARAWSWKTWAAHADEYLGLLGRLLSPDLVIIGGGLSKDADRFLPRLTLKAEVTAALLQNDAGIVGAAIGASEASTGGDRSGGLAA
jgi:polyphosphate glucokinase